MSEYHSEIKKQLRSAVRKIDLSGQDRIDPEVSFRAYSQCFASLMHCIDTNAKLIGAAAEKIDDLDKRIRDLEGSV